MLVHRVMSQSNHCRSGKLHPHDLHSVCTMLNLKAIRAIFICVMRNFVLGCAYSHSIKLCCVWDWMFCWLELGWHNDLLTSFAILSVINQPFDKQAFRCLRCPHLYRYRHISTVHVFSCKSQLFACSACTSTLMDALVLIYYSVSSSFSQIGQGCHKMIKHNVIFWTLCQTWYLVWLLWRWHKLLAI